MEMERYEHVQWMIKDEKLREDLQRSHFKIVAARAGYLVQPWLPVDALRRVLLFGFVVAGLILGMFLHPLYLLLLVVGAAHSPRIVGEVAHYWGRVLRQHH